MSENLFGNSLVGRCWSICLRVWRPERVFECLLSVEDEDESVRGSDGDESRGRGHHRGQAGVHLGPQPGGHQLRRDSFQDHMPENTGAARFSGY